MSVFRRHEQAKKCEYGERVHEIEHGVFTPLVLSTTGSLGNEATVFYKRLADLLSIKQQKHYSVVMCWLRCRLGFAILRSAITCMMGSRSSRHHPTRDPNIPSYRLRRSSHIRPSEHHGESYPNCYICMEFHYIFFFF